MHRDTQTICLAHSAPAQGAFDASRAPLFNLTAAKAIAYLVERTEAALTEALDDPLDVVKSATRELLAYYTNATTSANPTEVTWAKRYTGALATLRIERNAAAGVAEIRRATAEATAAGSETNIDQNIAVPNVVRFAASGEVYARGAPECPSSASTRTVSNRLPSPPIPRHIAAYRSH